MVTVQKCQIPFLGLLAARLVIISSRGGGGVVEGLCICLGDPLPVGGRVGTRAQAASHDSAGKARSPGI